MSWIERLQTLDEKSEFLGRELQKVQEALFTVFAVPHPRHQSFFSDAQRPTLRPYQTACLAMQAIGTWGRVRRRYDYARRV